MNVVREINKINEQELQLGVKGSWHDEYKDSAYVFVGGLSYDLTEGDVITIMSQFGEVIDINMPRDKETGKPKGFGFLMYEDQRSTVLAVDNMNGAQVLGRTIRVDHCKKYEQRGTKNAEGDYVAPEEPTYNAMPPTLEGSSDEDSSESEADDLDEEDPMAAYLRQQRKTQKITDGKKRKRDRDGETKEERKARKEDKKRRKEDRDRKRREREAKKGGASSRKPEAGSSKLRNGSASPRPARDRDTRREGAGEARRSYVEDDQDYRQERGSGSRRNEEAPRDLDRRRDRDDRDRDRYHDDRDRRRYDDDRDDRSRRDYEYDRRDEARRHRR